jgi:hypothetical protein
VANRHNSPRKCLEGIRTTTKTVSQDNRCPGRDSNRAPLRDKSSALPLLLPTCPPSSFVSVSLISYFTSFISPLYLSLILLRACFKSLIPSSVTVCFCFLLASYLLHLSDTESIILWVMSLKKEGGDRKLWW